MNIRKISPWKWVPTTYFMEGLPFVIVVTVSSIFLKSVGFKNSQITSYAGWFMIPWTMKPVWAGIIEVYKTKKYWIYFTELYFAISLFILAFLIHANTNITIVIIIMFIVLAFISANHDIATDGFYLMNLTSGQQSFFVGMQNASYQFAQLFGGGILMILYEKLTIVTNHDILLSWSIVFVVTGMLSLCLSIYHYYALPNREFSKPISLNQYFSKAKKDVISFLKLNNLFITVCFALTFRLSENMISKIIPLFMLDSYVNGGLQLSIKYVGIANSCNIAATLLAVIFGGIIVSKFGLKKCLWPMLFLTNLPHLIFIFMSNKLIESSVVAFIFLQCIEFFMTGVSLAGYSLVMFYLLRDSQYKTSHYAFLTAIVAFSNMIPSMLNGSIQEYLGYHYYFVFINMLIIPSLLILPFVRIDPQFGIMPGKK